MRPDTTGYTLIGMARHLAWEGPGWPEPGTYAAAVLDGLYWGDLAPWDASEHTGEAADFGVMVIGGVARPLARAYSEADTRHRAGLFAAQWRHLRSIVGESKPERALTFAVVPADELTPLIKGCLGVFRWCHGEGLNPPPE